MFNIEHNSFSSVHLKLREKSSISNSTDNDNNKIYKTRRNAEWDETRKTKVINMKEMWQVEKNSDKNKKPCNVSGGKGKTLTQEINLLNGFLQLCCDGNRAAKGWQCQRQVTDTYFSFSLCCQEGAVRILFSLVIREVWSGKDTVCIREKNSLVKSCLCERRRKVFEPCCTISNIHHLWIQETHSSPVNVTLPVFAWQCSTNPASRKFTTERWHLRVAQSLTPAFYCVRRRDRCHAEL